MRFPGSPRERRAAKMGKHLTGALLLAGFVGLLSGCLGQGMYRVMPYGAGVNISTLEKNWQDYDVYFAGLDVGNPSAVMFHPKNDDRLITVDRWSKVESRELLEELIGSIQRQTGTSYYPQLLELLGPGGHLYAYMFTAWSVVSTRMINDHTMFVFDIPLPPYLAVSGGEGVTDMRQP
jgi:hypothetical protein